MWYSSTVTAASSESNALGRPSKYSPVRNVGSTHITLPQDVTTNPSVSRTALGAAGTPAGKKKRTTGWISSETPSHAYTPVPSLTYLQTRLSTRLSECDPKIACKELRAHRIYCKLQIACGVDGWQHLHWLAMPDSPTRMVFGPHGTRRGRGRTRTGAHRHLEVHIQTGSGGRPGCLRNN